MTSQQLEAISDRLSKLHGHVYFRPAAGPLLDALRQAVLDSANGELVEELAEEGFGIELSIGSQEGDNDPVVTLAVDRPGIVHSSQIVLSQLDAEALGDLDDYLQRLTADAAPADPAATGKNVVRKRPEGDHHEKDAAAARLKVSPEWLKSVVPCTDYSYDEIDGKKYIREYFWSKDLIERLFKIKSSKTTPEDLQYVAQECCHGDVDWARDLIARLKSPNRPEPQQQAQKSQARPAQGQGQGRPGPKPEQSLRKPAQSGQGQAGQTAQSGQAAQPGQPGQPGQQKAGPNERVRSRSRHRKFRNQGSDGARKTDPSAGPKQPQS